MDMFFGCLAAFIFGGILCVIGQILIDSTSLTPQKILVFYVVTGVLLGALGIYEKAVNLFGCGATVPLTGFGYIIANGVKEAVNSYGFFGIFSGGITASAAGITLAVILGISASLITKPKIK